MILAHQVVRKEVVHKASRLFEDQHEVVVETCCISEEMFHEFRMLTEESNESRE